MHIKRVEVEGGFLDGLDLHLEPGLNVLIGSRGTGKSSVIELIRFCLDSTPLTDEFGLVGRQHALSVLGPGEVTVTLDIDGQDVLVSRSIDSLRPRSSIQIPYAPPTVLSQGEIELIGDDAPGRLRLIDGFRIPQESEADERAKIAQVSSLTKEMKALTAELHTILEQASSLNTLVGELAEAESAEAQALKTVTARKAEQLRRKQLDTALSEVSVRDALYQRVERGLSQWSGRIQQLLAIAPSVEGWPEAAGKPDPLPAIRAKLASSIEHLEAAVRLVNEAIEDIKTFTVANEQRQTTVEAEARSLRRQLEELQSGVGALTRRVSELKQRVSQTSALQTALQNKQANLQRVQSRRRMLLDEIDALREGRFNDRLAIAESLSTRLGPQIRVRVNRYGQNTEYASAIASVLRGSGLHYNTLAPILAAQLSPRELAEAVEADNPSPLQTIAGLDPERARRVIERALEVGTESLVSAPVDDSVDLLLFDGEEYRATDKLSLGQRCTTILPVLLGHRQDVLIIDQPEDNLDNAFIVDTLIKGDPRAEWRRPAHLCHTQREHTCARRRNPCGNDGVRWSTRICR